MTSDLQLLTRYHQQGDALAFRDLMQTHASMVYATARRITQNEAMAEDVTQETFLQLARQSRHITQSVAAWLHRVAWRVACNAVRNDTTRKRYEQAAAHEDTVEEREASWAEVETELDAAIDDLPEDLRAPLVLHFLQGRSQREIAAALGVSQSTVSRTVESGLTELRSRLRKKGLLCGAGLAVMLADQAIVAAPVALLNSLSKLGMSGIGTATAAPTASSMMSLVKVGVTVVGVWLIVDTYSTRLGESVMHTGAVSESIIRRVDPFPSSIPSMKVIPTPPSTPPPASVIGKPMPVHELVHSFPMPPRLPGGNLTQDANGWLWGTTNSGGRYGCGTLYRMRLDGSEWTEMVSFNGRVGSPCGTWPTGGVTQDASGALWGVTSSGGRRDAGTLYRYDPGTGAFSTEVEFQEPRSPMGRPIVTAEGQIWGTTMMGIYRYQPKTRQLITVAKFTGKTGQYPGAMCMADLMPDGRGWLWGTTSQGGAHDHGTIFKVSLSTGELQTLVQFTGKTGAFIGSQPSFGLTLHEQGYFWGCTRQGGIMDQGTIFKIHAETGAFTSVAEFKPDANLRLGFQPESKLIPDGAEHLWGTTSGGSLGKSTVYKLHLPTGKLSTVLTFSGVEGAAPGSAARGHLFRDGPDSFVAACGFGGTANSGVIYRVNIHSGQYSLVKDFGDLARTNEGVEPHGALCEGSDGTLWGTTFYHGAHHCGTIYKLDPITQKLVSVIDFTGRQGLNRGRNPDAGLVSDGRGYLWGTTRSGGHANVGTLFKIHETTGVLTTIADFGGNPQKIPGAGSMTELVLDEKGCLWGSSNNAVFKVDPRTHEIKAITTFKGDRAEPYGSSSVGTLGVDRQGFVWGCSLASRTSQRATLFKISTADDAFHIVSSFDRANQGWSGWHPNAHMHRDGTGTLWFTGVLDQGGERARCTLNRLDPSTGKIAAKYLQTGFTLIDTPISDNHGRLWGAMPGGGSEGSLYVFDKATQKFAKFLSFTGQGAQAQAGGQPMFGRLIKSRDGNFYSVTRYGGPGNGGTVYRLRFGPTPMTQQAIVLADGRVEFHGTLRPNGHDTEATFEWGLDPALADAHRLSAGIVPASDAAKPVSALLSGLKPGTTHYFRLIGKNSANAHPQCGAILQFTTAPSAQEASASVASVKPPRLQTEKRTLTAGQKHSLKVVLIPGAGAGIVSGALPGLAYSLGQPFTLTAQADNNYIFSHWSGPGITGPMAENIRLHGIFTEAMADSPVITATFVKNPFSKDLVGHFHGLVLAAENFTPSIHNTGALHLQITSLGSFSGRLLYDGEDIPFMGSFDTGGRARFGSLRDLNLVMERPEKSTLAMSLQIDLSKDGERQVVGYIGEVSSSEVLWQSHLQADRSLVTPRLPLEASVGFTSSVRHALRFISADFETVGTGSLHVLSAGHIHLAARLPDGTELLSQSPLSQKQRLSFFTPLYEGRRGSFGADLSLPDLLLKEEASNPQSAWWFLPDESQHTLVIEQP